MTMERVLLGFVCVSSLIVVVSAVSTSFAAIFGSTCPAKAAMSYFNPSLFTGLWFPMETSFVSPETLTVTCPTFSFELDSHFYERTFGDLRLNITQFYGMDRELESFMLRAFTNARYFMLNEKGKAVKKFYIIGTDYDYWAVIWVCSFTGLSEPSGVTYILTRARYFNSELPYEITMRVNSVLRAAGIPNRGFFIRYDHKHCPDYFDRPKFYF